MRWYLRFKLSFRDLVEMMAERGLSMAHTTIMRWVHHYAPEFVRRWNQFARSVGPSWRVDESYVKIRGKWVYLYRAVDCDGKTVDFRLSTRRDVTAAKAFFCKAIKVQGAPPRTITPIFNSALRQVIERTRQSARRRRRGTTRLVLAIICPITGDRATPEAGDTSLAATRSANRSMTHCRFA